MSFIADDKQSLRSAMLACHDWFDAASLEYWRIATAAQLERVDAGRRQRYASKIESFTASPPHDWLPDLSFSRLKRLKQLALPFGVPAKGIVTYLSRTLESLECNDIELTHEMQDYIMGVCTQLRELRINAPLGLFFYGGSFVRFLRNCCPGVTAFALFCDGKEPRADLVPYLAAQRPNLTVFTSNMTITSAILDEVLQQTERPFPNLCTLDGVKLESGALKTLATALRASGSIRQLHLRVLDSRVAVLPALGALAQLLVLWIRYTAPTVLTFADVLALRGLAQLEELSLDAAAETLRVTAFADREFALLVAGLPRLTVLHFLARTDVTPAALRIVGEKCRALHTLGMLQRCQPERFPDPAKRASAAVSSSGAPPPERLFPELKTLWVACADPNEMYWPQMPVKYDFTAKGGGKSAGGDEWLDQSWYAREERLKAKLREYHAPKVEKLDCEDGVNVRIPENPSWARNATDN